MNKRIDASSSEGISPLGIFLSELHDNIVRAEITGKVADYIPELAKADPNWFGISIATNEANIAGIGSFIHNPVNFESVYIQQGLQKQVAQHQKLWFRLASPTRSPSCHKACSTP